MDYGVQGAAPLPLERGKYVVRVSATGHVVTSTPFEEGSGRDEFYYVADSRRSKLTWGRDGMIQARRVGELPVSITRPWERQRRANQGRFYELYFVGTKQQQRAFEKSGADNPNGSGPMPDSTGQDRSTGAPESMPPPVTLSQKAVLGDQPPPSEVQPGIHYHEGKTPYIVLVVKKGNDRVPKEASTPKGSASYELELWQDGEREASGEIITPSMGLTEILRLHTPPGVPVLVRRWLMANDPKYGDDSFPYMMLYRTKHDIYEDIWLRGGEQVLTRPVGP